MLVTIAPLVVATHRTGSAQLRHHAPRRISEIKIRSKILGKYRSLTQPLISIKAEFRTAEGIVIAHELRPEHLLDIQIDAPMRIRQIIAIIINQRYTRSHIPGMLIHALQQFWPFYLLSDYIIISRHRSYIEVISHLDEEACFHLSLPSFHIALVVVVIAHLKAHSPEIRRE